MRCTASTFVNLQPPLVTLNGDSFSSKYIFRSDASLYRYIDSCIGSR